MKTLIAVMLLSGYGLGQSFCNPTNAKNPKMQCYTLKPGDCLRVDTHGNMEKVDYCGNKKPTILKITDSGKPKLGQCAQVDKNNNIVFVPCKVQP